MLMVIRRLLPTEYSILIAVKKNCPADDDYCQFPLKLWSSISQEPAGEKGILEQSQITLVSVTDTTVDEPDTTVTDEATWGDKDPDAMAETEVTEANSQ